MDAVSSPKMPRLLNDTIRAGYSRYYQCRRERHKWTKPSPLEERYPKLQTGNDSALGGRRPKNRPRCDLSALAFRNVRSPALWVWIIPCSDGNNDIYQNAKRSFQVIGFKVPVRGRQSFPLSQSKPGEPGPEGGSSVPEKISHDQYGQKEDHCHEYLYSCN